MRTTRCKRCHQPVNQERRCLSCGAPTGDRWSTVLMTWLAVAGILVFLSVPW